MTTQVFLFVVLGLAFGSFGNVLILRLKAGTSLGGRSHCMSCKQKLSVVDLVPVFSFVFLGGRCRQCGKAISMQYPIVEILSACMFGLAAVLYPADLTLAILTALLLYFLLLGAVFDIRFQELPDSFTGMIAVCAFLIAVVAQHLPSSAMGLLVALMWFGGQWVLSKGRAVGTGDIFLSAALGIWLGFRGTITMLLLSYMVGAVVVLLLLWFGVLSMKHQRIAFGPFLAAGALLTILGVGQMYMVLL